MAAKEDKLAPDAVKAQWRKQNEAHQRQEKLLAQIATAVGLTLDADGNVTEAIPKKPAAADTKLVIGDDYYLANNKQALQAVDAHNEKWLRLFHGKIDALLAPLQQLVGRLVVMMVKQESAAQPPAAAPRKPSLLSRALRWLYADCISSIWKYLAYSLAVLATVFALCQWHQNRRLTRLAKEYAIVRAVFGASPRNAALINRLDSLIATDDFDRVYQYATQETADRNLVKSDIDTLLTSKEAAANPP